MEWLEDSLLDTRDVAIHLDDLVPNIHVDAGVSIPLLSDAKSYFQSIARSDSD